MVGYKDWTEDEQKKKNKKKKKKRQKKTNFKTSVVLLKITLNKIRSPPLKLLLSKM